MIRSGQFRRFFAAAGVLTLAACQDSTQPTSPNVEPSLQVQSAQGGDLPSAAALDRAVPGFGGFFLDNGTPTVYLTAGASRVAAERALGGYLASRGLSASSVRVLQGRYGWQQLERWYGAATPEALAIDGAVYVDNDERTNRVKIGVSDARAMGAIRAAVARLGVPSEAVIIERADPIVQVATLQNVTDRPVQAGVQINFPGYLCSIGFNATTPGGQKSFVTASHCTNTQGGVESTPYWQPLQSVNPTQLATEVADPVYVKNGPGCPRGKKCRYSDASRAAYINGADQALGSIAATSGPNNGSLTVTGSFSITSDDCTNTLGGCLAVGTTVNKVGRTTGWTAGNITNTCVNTGVQGTQIVQRCQTFVSAGVGGGDSGSDVFQIVGGNAKLAGVLWGGNGAGTQFVFSALANVTSELGALTTH